MASLAVAVGVWYVYRIAEREFNAGRTLLDMAPYFLITGFGCAHLVSLFFYFPDHLQSQDFFSLTNLITGLSAFGGLFGGALGTYFFVSKRKLPYLPWLDILARGFSLAFIFGRAGCTLAHDHPGKATDFFLSVNYPPFQNYPSGPRHDLGFYELLLWPLIFFVFRCLSRKQRPDGFFIGLLILFYSPIRFGLDFLRLNDVTYTGLTLAQWSCIAVAPIGVRLIQKTRQAPVYSQTIG